MSQKNISAGKNFVGRDYTETKITIQNEIKTETLLKKLFEKYKNDVETENTTNTIIEELRAYYTKEDETVEERDLERKLKEAGREELCKQARRYKEMFRQKIERYRLFPAAQAIYAYLLGQVLTRFDTYVQPAIKAGKSEEEIIRLVHEEIVEAIVQSIPETEPTCDHPSLHGMVYFLTGNCFIEW